MKHNFGIQQSAEFYQGEMKGDIKIYEWLPTLPLLSLGIVS